jgi:ABC-2 type transport system permease protein
VHYLSWVLAPTWGYRAIRAAALGGDPWPGIAWCIVLAAVYLAIGHVFLHVFERRARQKATLSLV